MADQLKIRQIQVAHNAIEDRLLIRIATQNSEEIGVFITRRFLRELWPFLVTILLDHLSNATPVLASNQPKNSPSGASFDEDFSNENPKFPLGEKPLLATEVNIELAGQNAVKITFREAQQRNISLNLDSDLMHALCSMLRSTSEQAGWDFQLDYVKQKPTAAIQSAPAIRRMLH